jgi:hypothetical protein
MHTGFRRGNLRASDHLKNVGVDGRIIFKWIFSKWGWVMDRIDVFQDRDRWIALVNEVMDL